MLISWTRFLEKNRTGEKQVSRGYKGRIVITKQKSLVLNLTSHKDYITFL